MTDRQTDKNLSRIFVVVRGRKIVTGTTYTLTETCLQVAWQMSDNVFDDETMSDRDFAQNKYETWKSSRDVR